MHEKLLKGITLALLRSVGSDRQVSLCSRCSIGEALIQSSSYYNAGTVMLICLVLFTILVSVHNIMPNHPVCFLGAQVTILQVAA